MRKGDVPIGYIVAIVLGIAVIGLIGWWLFINYFKGKCVGETAECLGYKIGICTGMTGLEEKAKQACTCITSPIPKDKNDPECNKLLQKQ